MIDQRASGLYFDAAYRAKDFPLDVGLTNVTFQIMQGQKRFRAHVTYVVPGALFMSRHVVFVTLHIWK